MIVLVRINRCRAAGGSVEACAYRAWRLGGLLRNTSLRNKMKYLVAMNGSTVEGVFCIRGVAPDALPGRVQFDITPVNNDCFNIIENLITQLNQATNKLKYIQGASYLYQERFRNAGIEIPELKCCDYDNIPLMEAIHIENKVRPEI